MHEVDPQPPTSYQAKRVDNFSGFANEFRLPSAAVDCLARCTGISPGPYSLVSGESTCVVDNLKLILTFI